MNDVNPANTAIEPISGGPEGNAPATAEVSQPAPTAPAVATSPSSQQVFVGGRMFNSTEEALAFADQAARKAQDAEAQLLAVRQQQVRQTEVNPADILFEDPAAAVRLLEQKILNQIDTRASAQKQEQDVWTGFYASNPDLKGFEDIVDLNKGKLWGEISTLPLDQSLPRLATAARNHLAKIRGQQNQTTTQLPSAPAQVIGGGGGTSAGAGRPVQAEKKTFVQELNEARLAKRKTG